MHTNANASTYQSDICCKTKSQHLCFYLHMVHVIVKFLKLVEFKNNTIMISIVWQDQIDSSGLFDYFSNYLN